MRKTLYIITVLLITSSCIGQWEKKWLTVENIGKSTIASFFAEIGGLEAAGEGLHSEMENFYDGVYIKYAEIMGENCNICTVTADEGDYLLYNYSMSPSYISTYPRNVWVRGWSVVTAANNIIYYAPQLREKYSSASDQATIDKVLAWGYFGRALGHWCLCNCYAQPYNYTSDASHIGVPVVDYIPGFDDVIPRAKVSEVYDLVLADLEKAHDLLGESATVGDAYHVNSIACEAFLSRVYLFMQDYDKAESYSSKVISKMKLTSRDKYVDMFRRPYSNVGEEAILRWNQYSGTSTLENSTDPTRSGQDIYPCPDLASCYESDDIRVELLTYVAEDTEEEQFRGQSFPAICKYCPYKSITANEKVPNPFMFRLSEMYLVHAEAVANGKKDLAAAASDIAALEARARGVEASEISLSYTDLDSMNELIALERKKELCFEGHTFFDSVRRGKGVHRTAGSNASVKDVDYGDYRLVLPIDQTEMQANEKMIQNEGYQKEGN